MLCRVLRLPTQDCPGRSRRTRKLADPYFKAAQSKVVRELIVTAVEHDPTDGCTGWHAHREPNGMPALRTGRGRWSSHWSGGRVGAHVAIDGIGGGVSGGQDVR